MCHPVPLLWVRFLTHLILSSQTSVEDGLSRSTGALIFHVLLAIPFRLLCLFITGLADVPPANEVGGLVLRRSTGTAIVSSIFISILFVPTG